MMCEGARRAFGGLNPLHLDVVRGWARDQVDRLAALGMLVVRDVQRETGEWGLTEVHGGTAELTPAPLTRAPGRRPFRCLQSASATSYTSAAGAASSRSANCCFSTVRWLSSSALRSSLRTRAMNSSVT